MGLFVGLVLAGAATMMPVNTILLISRDDLPPAERAAKQSAGAVVSFMVDAAGYTLRCTTIATVGDEHLTGGICPAMMLRWHKPAHRANGEKVPFVEREFIRLLVPDTP